MQQFNPRIICLEGIDGSGKTTQVRNLHNWLTSLGVDCLTTSDLAGTWLSHKVKEVILQSAENEVDDIAELFLFSAARKQHFSQILLPALEAGKTIILDRFIDSTIAYQRYGLKIPAMLVDQIIKFTVGNLNPDLLIYLDLPIDQVEARTSPDKITQRGLDFYQRVSLGYRQILKQRYTPETSVRIDATKNEEEIFQLIKTFLIDSV